MAEDDAVSRYTEGLGKNPWDWIAFGVGAVGGLVASTSIAGLDGGTSIGVGAMTAVTARRAAVAARRGARIRKKCERLQKFVASQAASSQPPHAQTFAKLEFAIGQDRQLWEMKILSHNRFDTLLDRHIADVRKLMNT